MIKKVKVSQLKPGMYVHDLGAAWEDHPFLTNSFKITSEKIIDKIFEAGIREVYIDTSRGLDVKDAPSQSEISMEIERKLKKLASSGDGYGKEIENLREELKKTKEFIQTNKFVIKKIMKDVTHYKPLNKDKVIKIIDDLNTKINKDTLLILLKIKNAMDYTYLHSISVGALMTLFCDYLKIPEHIKIDVSIGSFLHDIGKCYIPESLINKPAKLTHQEFRFIKKHVDFSKEILEKNEDFSYITISTAYEHHERYDGTGYPKGLKGDQISKFGQMISIVDVYDAISSNRSYHKGLDPAIAVRKIFEWSEYTFNRELVQHFIKCIGVYPIGSLVKLKSNFLAIVIKQNHKNLTLPVVLKIYNIEKDEFLSKPLEIDLANDDDEIESLESTIAWNIDIFKYLNIKP